MKKIFFVSDEYINTRIDRWIKKKVIKIPQSLIEKNLRKGNIKINNKKEKSSYKLRKRDEIIFYNYNQLEKRITKSKFLFLCSLDFKSYENMSHDIRNTIESNWSWNDRVGNFTKAYDALLQK